jgi:hypothetical protein
MSGWQLHESGNGGERKEIERVKKLILFLIQNWLQYKSNAKKDETR